MMNKLALEFRIV